MTEDSSLTHLVTGSADFLGSHLIDSLLTEKTAREVRERDNFFLGQREHLVQHTKNPKLKICLSQK
jgi:nucleoside-diphosphate-sugar epimerase